jgi:hypothetical protein
MANISPTKFSNGDESPAASARQHESDHQRETVHDLMNHLTVIDLCAFQLRGTVNPFTLAALDRAVENAMRAAKRLAAEINSHAASPS